MIFMLIKCKLFGYNTHGLAN